MSDWEKLLSPAPEATSWPPGFAEFCATATAKSCSPLSPKSTSASVRLPSVTSGRRPSIPRSQVHSVGTLSLERQAWSEHGSTWSGDDSVASITRQSPVVDVSSSLSISSWGDRRQRGSKYIVAERDDGQKRRLSSKGVAHKPLSKKLPRTSNVADDTLRGGMKSSGKKARVLDRDEGGDDGPGGVAAFVDIDSTGSASTSSRGSESLESAPETTFPVVVPPCIEQSKNLSRQAANIPKTSFRHEQYIEAQTDSSVSSSGTSFTLSTRQAASAPDRTDWHRNMEEEINRDGANRLLTGEQREGADIVIRRWTDLTKGFVPGEDGLVSTNDRRRNAFHNFVYRRRRRETPKRSASLGDTAVAGDSATCSSLGDTDASTAVQSHEGGSRCASHNGEGLLRSGPGWDSVPGRLDRFRVPGQPEQPTTAPPTTHDALSVRSYSSENRNVGCCGAADRPLKCQRCGSARVQLFVTSPKVDRNGTSPGHGQTAAGRRKGAARPPLAPIAPNARTPGPGLAGRDSNERTVASPWAPEDGIINGDGGGAAHDDVVPNRGRHASWDKGWCHRGRGLRGRSGDSMLVPARRSKPLSTLTPLS